MKKHRSPCFYGRLRCFFIDKPSFEWPRRIKKLYESLAMLNVFPDSALAIPSGNTGKKLQTP